MPESLWSRVADLPLTVDAHVMHAVEAPTADERATYLVRLQGDGAHGLGEEVGGDMLDKNGAFLAAASPRRCASSTRSDSATRRSTARSVAASSGTPACASSSTRRRRGPRRWPPRSPRPALSMSSTSRAATSAPSRTRAPSCYVRGGP